MIISESRMKMNVEMLFYSDNLLIFVCISRFLGMVGPDTEKKAGQPNSALCLIKWNTVSRNVGYLMEIW